ncbi:radical SAM/SPASM domain-containing protein [Deferribacterales bacterium]|nr:radical SAM/SPASM domain-containing protein [Deferribacterales bacterium]
MSCVHCRSSADAGISAGRWGLVELDRLFADIVAFASPVVVLSGGEPLLRDDVFDVAKAGAKVGLRMAMATNGLLVNDDTCRRIKDSGIKIVSMSLDGATREVHDNFRGQQGAFDAFMRASECFNRHGIKFIVNSSFTKRNRSDIEATYRLAKSVGAVAWYMFLIVPTGRGQDIMDELISKDDYEEILLWHYKMEREETEVLVRPTCAPQYYRVWEQQSRIEGISMERRSLSFSAGGGKGCIAGQSIMFINSNGDVFPCSYFPLVAGNVFEQSIEDIWDKSELFEGLRDFSRYEGKCGVCSYVGVCGGCRARSYAMTGSCFAPEPHCSYIPKH